MRTLYALIDIGVALAGLLAILELISTLIGGIE